MKAIKVVLSAAVAAAAVLAIARWCYLPISCDVMQKRIDKSTTALLENPNWLTGIKAHQNLTEIRHCMGVMPGKVSIYMTAAANSRLVGAPDEAIALYETALRYDRRPEIYANIAECQLSMNKKNDAVGNFVTAGMFSPVYIAGIDDYDVRMRVDEIVSKQRALPWHVSMESE
jgi:tetratricopeptide (TPR) repeat protein